MSPTLPNRRPSGNIQPGTQQPPTGTAPSTVGGNGKKPKLPVRYGSHPDRRATSVPPLEEDEQNSTQARSRHKYIDASKTFPFNQAPELDPTHARREGGDPPNPIPNIPSRPQERSRRKATDGTAGHGAFPTLMQRVPSGPESGLVKPVPTNTRARNDKPPKTKAKSKTRKVVEFFGFKLKDRGTESTAAVAARFPGTTPVPKKHYRSYPGS